MIKISVLEIPEANSAASQWYDEIDFWTDDQLFEDKKKCFLGPPIVSQVLYP